MVAGIQCYRFITMLLCLCFDVIKQGSRVSLTTKSFKCNKIINVNMFAIVQEMQMPVTNGCNCFITFDPATAARSDFVAAQSSCWLEAGRVAGQIEDTSESSAGADPQDRKRALSD